jgi:uncharacterized protein
MKNHLRVAPAGLLLGFALGFIGFADWGEVHKMFTFQDLRLVLVFGGGVTLTGIGLNLLVKDVRKKFPKPIHKGTLLGGALFGAGWALSGACPAIVMVQLGEGRLPALLTGAGVIAGTWTYGRVHRKFFRWDSGGCDI